MKMFFRSDTVHYYYSSSPSSFLLTLKGRGATKDFSPKVSFISLVIEFGLDNMTTNYFFFGVFFFTFIISKFSSASFIFLTNNSSILTFRVSFFPYLSISIATTTGIKCFQCGELSGLPCQLFDTDKIQYQKVCNDSVQSCITQFLGGGTF